MEPGRKRRRTLLPPYVGYLVSRAAALYLLAPHANPFSATTNFEAHSNKLIALLAALHILTKAEAAARSLVIGTLRAASSVETVESYLPSGYLDVVTTAKRTAKYAPPVWKRVRRGLRLHERLCLCNTLSLITDAAEGLVAQLRATKQLFGQIYNINFSDIRPLTRLQRRALRSIATLRALSRRVCGRLHGGGVAEPLCVKAFRARGVQIAKSYAALRLLVEALQRALNMSRVDLDVKSRGAGLSVSREAAPRLALRVFVEKLYELYVLYVVLKALQSFGRLRGEDSTIVVTLDGNGIRVFYNSRPKVNGEPISRVALGESDSLDSGELERISGVPDITLLVNNRVKAVIEVKHSRNIGYLTLARFKTLAYIHEYDADAGILVYPGIRLRENRGIIIDAEYDATRTLLRRAEDRGYVKIRLRRNAVLYILPLQPYEEYEYLNVKMMHEVITNIVDADTMK